MAKVFNTLLLLIVAALKISAQGTFTAPDCQYNTINALVNGPTHVAVDGDIFKIPAGNCTWGNQLIVPDRIGVQFLGFGTPNSLSSQSGASSSCTQTKLTPATGGSLFQMTPTVGNSLSRISCMQMNPPAMGTSLSPIFVVTGAAGQSTGACNATGCPNFRLDNMTVPQGWDSAGVSDGTFAVVDNVFGVADHNTVGDNSNPGSGGIDFINVHFGRWQGVGGNGDNSWATADTFGTNQAFYLENNVFVWSFGTDVDTNGPDYGGGRWVCRFNSFSPVTTASACTNHGTDTNSRNRSGRQHEFYRNTMSCVSQPPANCSAVIGGRGGAWLIFDNAITSGDNFANTYINMTFQRPWRPQSPFGSCSGDSPWDNNDTGFATLGPFSLTSFSGTTLTFTGTPFTGQNFAPTATGQVFEAVDISQTVSMGPTGNHPGLRIASNTNNTITTFEPTCSSDGSTCPVANDSIDIKRVNNCMDQSMRGQGLLVTNDTTPVLQSTGNPGNVANALDPLYEANNSGAPMECSTPPNCKGGGDPGLVANKDLYMESVNQAAQTSTTSPFNGTSGSGHGTLALRPTSCTPAVGYWATDQGTWNHSGSGAQGTLYTCSATNTGGCTAAGGNFWCTKYTPFTYPHPLIQAVAASSPSSGDSIDRPGFFQTNSIPANLTGATTLYGWSLANLDPANACWVQFFPLPSALVTVGTTTPAFSIQLPANANNYQPAGSVGMAFSSPGWSLASTTTANGATVCPAGTTITVFFN